MNENLVNKVGECGVDNLIAHVVPPAHTMAVKVTAEEAGTVKRGTFLTTDDGKKWSATGTDYSGKYAPCILCDDVEVTEENKEEGVPAAAYSSGCFNVDAIITKDEVEVTTKIRDDLRQYDIFLVPMRK